MAAKIVAFGVILPPDKNMWVKFQIQDGGNRHLAVSGDTIVIHRMISS